MRENGHQALPQAMGRSLCALEGQSAAGESETLFRAGVIVPQAFGLVLWSLIEAALGPQGQEQTDKG